MGIDIDLLADELRRDEGFRDTIYQCSAGKFTLGYGHNVEDNPIPKIVAEHLLNYDIGGAIRDCERFDWFYELSDVRKRVIINMVFQMGVTGVSKFKNMIRAIEGQDYNRAANEMRDSKWFRQTPNRAERLAQAMHYRV